MNSMEASMRMLIKPRYPKLISNFTPNNPQLISHTPYSSLSYSLTSTHFNSISPNSNSNSNSKLGLGLGFFLSFSSPSQFHLHHRNNNLNSTPSNHNHHFSSSASSFYNWHVSSAPFSGGPARGKCQVAAVVLGWLGAEPKHLRRYAELYTCRGIDAVTFVVPVKDLLWFDLGRKVENRIRELADEIVRWLSSGDGGGDRWLVFHTFSNTGWFVYGAILGQLQQERPDLIERIKGCIFDSGPDPDLNPKVWAAGFGAALLKKRNIALSPYSKDVKPSISENKSNLQNEDLVEALVLGLLEKMMVFLFKVPDVNQRLSMIISILSENQPLCPQLYLYSTADKIVPYQSIESFLEHQKAKGRNVWQFNFGSSPHVDHFRTFPDEYTSQINNFLTVLFKQM